MRSSTHTRKGEGDLFEHSRQEQLKREAPLAARMRPQTLDEFVGQEDIVGEGKLLRRAIQADQLGSIILWGPPGTGKTTLAMVIANTTRSHFQAISAVMAGVADIRRVIEEAKELRAMYGRRTILLVDEIHRFNKAQQDALLPHVEDGTIVLVGATTENPYFEVISALVSRSRIFQLQPLTEEHIRTILERALADPDRGYGKWKVTVDREAIDHLVRMSGGDARVALNALELAVTTTPADRDGRVHVTLTVAEDSIQKRAVLYDKQGDAHYDTISAFIKSLRGSDPDAALYWLAKMVYAGEDPKFIVRRMIILASEDVGLADPNALVVAVSAAQAVQWVGLPEAQYALAEAALYLATAPKSNSAGAYWKALEEVQQLGKVEVPDHLKDATRDAEGLGHGKGYVYPHEFPGHWIEQQYLPAALKGHTYYQPGSLGYEKKIKEWLEALRSGKASEGAGTGGSGKAGPPTKPEAPEG